MIKCIFNCWYRWKTKNLTQIPVFCMTFDYRKYKKYGKKNSCAFYCYPDIAKDEFVKEKLCEVVDYVRDNYDLDEMVRI
uniref:Uncharacterized protein n=1 Tax=virus sp. ctQmo6 TaxID=2827990 RepID=A0A8S5RFC8_9VIRU|nr:MAG TPA: hypothetical protein [virus sp. ctQmo6]